jgi:adenine-specific DNA-methyltransferase
MKSNNVIVVKHANPLAEMSTLEGEIDELVYQLYGLTEDEIKIVEEK